MYLSPGTALNISPSGKKYGIYKYAYHEGCNRTNTRSVWFYPNELCMLVVPVQENCFPLD